MSWQEREDRIRRRRAWAWILFWLAITAAMIWIDIHLTVTPQR
jgi:uncharacterized membrane protein YhaH (DUF805 family)